MENIRHGKCGRKDRASRSRKRKYYGNQHSKNKEDVVNTIVEEQEDVPYQNVPEEEVTICRDQQDEDTATSTSASAKKLKSIAVPEAVEAPINCNIIVNTSLMATFFEKLSKCPLCCECIEIQYDVEKKKCLAHFFSAKCKSTSCNWTDCFSTSKTVGSEGRGRRAYEINLCSCLVFRELGKGYNSIKVFCKLMNIPPPRDSKTYRKSFTKLYRAYTEVACQSMQNAAEEVTPIPDETGIKNVMASFDGTWQRRGYSSLNGVISCISQGKVVDYDVLCKVCPQCKYWNLKQQSGNDTMPAQ